MSDGTATISSVRPGDIFQVGEVKATGRPVGFIVLCVKRGRAKIKRAWSTCGKPAVSGGPKLRSRWEALRYVVQFLRIRRLATRD